MLGEGEIVAAPASAVTRASRVPLVVLVAGDGSIPPGAVVRFGARIDDLTRRELDEELADVVIYVYEPHRCPR